MNFRLVVLAVLSSAARGLGWSLTIFATDTRKANFHGTVDTGCKPISFDPSLNVNKAVYKPVTKDMPDPDSFALYIDTECKRLSYQSNKGTHNVSPAQVIKAYRIKY